MHACRQTEKQTGGKTYRQNRTGQTAHQPAIDQSKHTDRQADRQPEIHTDRQEYSKTDRQAARQEGRQIPQTSRQSKIHAYKQTCKDLAD